MGYDIGIRSDRWEAEVILELDFPPNLSVGIFIIFIFLPIFGPGISENWPRFQFLPFYALGGSKYQKSV